MVGHAHGTHMVHAPCVGVGVPVVSSQVRLLIRFCFWTTRLAAPPHQVWQPALRSARWQTRWVTESGRSVKLKRKSMMSRAKGAPVRCTFFSPTHFSVQNEKVLVDRQAARRCWRTRSPPRCATSIALLQRRRQAARPHSSRGCLLQSMILLTTKSRSNVCIRILHCSDCYWRDRDRV